MKKFNYVICLVALAGNCYYATAQNKDAQTKDARAKEAKDAEMKAWMEYMTPGPMHQMLAKSDGVWNQDITMWMAPDAPPSKSTATCTNRMILGGRYQESKSTGSFEGMPFEGISTVGYDNTKKVFMSSWIDNMGTGIMYTEGKYDEKTKTIHFTGDCVDPMTGKEMKVRETFKIIDDNNQYMEMFMTKDGKEFKTMEIKFSRKV